jgi:hypothetical protein
VVNIVEVNFIHPLTIWFTRNRTLTELIAGAIQPENRTAISTLPQ